MEQFIWETPEELDQKLAQRVRKIRKRRSITQEKLASISGVSYGSIKRFETTGQISLLSLNEKLQSHWILQMSSEIFSRRYRIKIFRRLSMKQDKVLQVCYEDQTVGTLAMTADHKVAFQYSDEWLETGFSINPFSLPLQKQVFCSS